MVAPGLVNRGRLVTELRDAVAGEVRFDEGSRALYANDASIYRQVPLGVVIPRGPEDVLAALAVCRREGVPVHARGCGTGLAGQTVNSGVVFGFSKYMNRILELDPVRRIARVRPGVICDELRDAAGRHDLTFAPDPATHDRCTLGGMIGNNSCGTHSVVGGNTLGLIKWEQMVFLGNPEYGVDMAPMDFVLFAEACGARGMRIDDPAKCGDQLAEALAWDGPVIVECVVDEHEPPIPAKVKKDQVEKLASALRQGTPNRNRIALQMVKDMLDESSFDASPGHHVPTPIGKAAAKLVDKLRPGESES